MTITYEVLRIPRTMEEVVDKARRKGSDTVDVFVTWRNEGTLVPGAQKMRYRVGLKVGRYKLTLLSYEKYFEGYVAEGNQDLDGSVVRGGWYASEYASNLARELNRQGVKARINDRPFGSTKKESKQED